MIGLTDLLAGATPPPEPGGVSDKAHLFLAAVVVLALGFTLAGVRRHKLRSRYSLLWLSIAVALVPLAAFPDLLDRISLRLGISYPPAVILSLSVAFLFLVSVHLSWEVSRADDRLRVLAEEIALLRAELDPQRPGPAASPQPASTSERDRSTRDVRPGPTDPPVADGLAP